MSRDGKKTGGRPLHEPTEQSRAMVRAMAGWGVPQAHISKAVGCTKETLHKYYRDELDDGAAQAIAAVSKNLYRIATGDGRDALTAAIFFLKCRAGWKPPADIEINNNVSASATASVTASKDDKAAMAAYFEQLRQRVSDPAKQTLARQS